MDVSHIPSLSQPTSYNSQCAMISHVDPHQTPLQLCNTSWRGVNIGTAIKNLILRLHMVTCPRQLTSFHNFLCFIKQNLQLPQFFMIVSTRYCGNKGWWPLPGIIARQMLSSHAEQYCIFHGRVFIVSRSVASCRGTLSFI